MKNEKKCGSIALLTLAALTLTALTGPEEIWLGLVSLLALGRLSTASKMLDPAEAEIILKPLESIYACDHDEGLKRAFYYLSEEHNTVISASFPEIGKVPQDCNTQLQTFLSSVPNKKRQIKESIRNNPVVLRACSPLLASNPDGDFTAGAEVSTQIIRRSLVGNKDLMAYMALALLNEHPAIHSFKGTSKNSSFWIGGLKKQA